MKPYILDLVCFISFLDTWHILGHYMNGSKFVP
ncbi:MAG: hypothetical protein ACD_81C00186G0015 [uncultured bacterium]|nr:MAG: hypothetical protein ACD_81C00186G0015 [uncultured bacterium]